MDGFPHNEAEDPSWREELLLRPVIESAPVAMVLVSADGTVHEVNPEAERIFGYSRDEVRSQPVELLIPERFRDGHRGMRAGYSHAPEARPMGAGRELFARRKDGSEFPVEVGLAPVEVKGARWVLCTVVDITERTRLQQEIIAHAAELERVNERLRQSDEQLQAANQELSVFATMVSHDLRAPLRAVAMRASWILANTAEKLDGEGRENLRLLIKRVEEMDRMITGMLHYSQIGREPENQGSVSLAELLPDVVKVLAFPAHVHVRIAPELPVVGGDPLRLRQVFQNLVDNAVKYGDKPTVEVRIDWAERDSLWEFRVTDNGPGIEERHFDRIFEMFQTLAPKDWNGSTGVGLALVKRIVEGKGGRAWVESCVGEGSSFHFTWPKQGFGGAGVQGSGSNPELLDTGHRTPNTEHGTLDDPDSLCGG